MYKRQLKCSEYIKEKCTNTKNIQVINNAKVTQLLGEDILNGIKITDLKIIKK